MILLHQMPKDSLWIINTKRIEWTYLLMMHLQNTMISVKIPFKFRWITKIRQGTFWINKSPLLPKTFLRKTWTNRTHKMRTFRILCRENRKDWSIFWSPKIINYRLSVGWMRWDACGRKIRLTFLMIKVQW